ncbi:MAG: hypothetical protein ACK4KW_03465 [Gemmobacter sp.]
MSPTLAIAALAGLALWTGTAILSGRAEPWDAPAFWQLSYPLALVLAAVFGALAPIRPWRWGAALVWTLAPVLAIGGAGLSMLPPGLVLIGLLSLPAMLAAGLGARLGRRFRRG